MSPANRLIVGIVLAPPAVSATGPWALRNPLADAAMLYVPAGTVRLNVPSGLAVTDAASELSALYKPTVTGLLARTCPVSVAAGSGVGEATGVDVNVGVGETSGVNVCEAVGVGDSIGVDVSVGVGDTSGVDVNIGVGDTSGVDVNVVVGDTSGVDVKMGVGDSTGVEVGTIPATVRLVPVEGRSVSILSPFETRALHSIALCPACKPLTLKVNTTPLVVALLPLLPAIATMKLPFCVPLIAVTGSAPKRPPTTMLLASSKFGS